MLFVDDIVLVAETREKVNNKLDEWSEALEGKGLRISRRMMMMIILVPHLPP